MKAQVVVDRVETLNMLQRDSRTLERAFEQAGLKTSDGALQFSLGSDSQAAEQRPPAGRRRRTGSDSTAS